jgi:hypothetical protein
MSTTNPSHSPIPSGRPLSALFIDPFVADAFVRAEREADGAFAVPAPSPGILQGGAAMQPPEEDGVPPGFGTFKENLNRLHSAVCLAYALAFSPHRSRAATLGAAREGGADPGLGQELLNVIVDGHEICENVLGLLAAVRRSLEEAVQ